MEGLTGTSVALAGGAGVPLLRDGLLYAVFVLAGLSILASLLTQVWVPYAQLRRFSRIFAGRPELVEAYNRVFDVYGWRARLAVKLFKLPVPPAVSADK